MSLDHKVWKQGYTLEDIQNGTIVLTIPAEARPILSISAEKADPQAFFQNLSPGMIDAQETGLAETFGYTVT